MISSIVSEENVYEKIVAECKRRNISLYKLCQQADVEWRTIAAWKKRNPKTFDIMQKIQEELDKVPVKTTNETTE
jgi:hypothetical protein